MNRKEMIDRLVDATLASMLADPDLVVLRGVLEKGCRGYTRMSSRALERELQLRGLLDFDEPEPGEDFDDDDEDFDDDEDCVEDDAELRFSARTNAAAATFASQIAPGC